MKRMICVGLLAVGFGLGCVWVDLDGGGEDVTVARADHVGGCVHLGTATGTTRTHVGLISRSRSAISGEVERLARNEAGSRGGDTIVTKTDLKNGSRTYDVYRCKKEPASGY